MATIFKGIHYHPLSYIDKNLLMMNKGKNDLAQHFNGSSNIKLD